MIMWIDREINSLFKVSHCVWRRNINIIQYTGHSLRVMRAWLVTARKLITQNSSNTKYTEKTILYICTYRDQLAVNNCQLYISNHNFLIGIYKIK